MIHIVHNRVRCCAYMQSCIHPRCPIHPLLLFPHMPGLNQTTLLWHNNILGLPIMLLYLVGGTNELRDVVSYPQLTSVPFWVRGVYATCVFTYTTIMCGYTTNMCVWYATNKHVWYATNMCVYYVVSTHLQVSSTHPPYTISPTPPPIQFHAQFFLVLSASQAFLLNLCIFKCTTINSPLATSVTGQIKDILTMGLGLLLFHDVSYHPVNVLGLVVGFCGGAAYSGVSFQEQRARDAAKRARYGWWVGGWGVSTCVGQ